MCLWIQREAGKVKKNKVVWAYRRFTPEPLSHGQDKCGVRGPLRPGDHLEIPLWVQIQKNTVSPHDNIEKGTEM